MKPLRNLSVRRKLGLILFGTSGVTLVLACATFLVYDQRSYRDVLARNLMSQAEIVGNRASAVLAYSSITGEGATEAYQLLDSLRANASLVHASLRLADGKLLASWPAQEIVPLQLGTAPPREAGIQFAGDWIHALHRVREKGEVVGWVHLISSRAELRQRLAQYIVVVLGVLILAGTVAWILFWRLQRLVTEPVRHLTETAGRVAAHKDYRVRAVKTGEDELGRLIDCFNEMLSQIEQRSAALQQARDELELRVTERTAQLSQANDQLRSEMTERTKLEAQLRQAQKMEAIGQLAGGVAHDFNNILTVILGHTALLLGADRLTEEEAEPLKEIEASARRAANLTRQLLTFSRRQVMRLATVNLNQALSNVSKMLQRLLGEHVALSFRFASDLPAVLADVTMMEQVVINLAVNSRDAMPDGGALLISTSLVSVGPEQVARNPDARPGQFVCLEVQDGGCGMDEATLQRIFEPFFTTKPQGKGTGLGLATVYGIIRQHEGWVDVRSVPGHGTTFWVYLPAVPKGQGTKADTSFWGGARGGSETILVVEDEDPVRNFVGLCLRRYGYQVIEARDGKHALDLWDEHRERVDLLLTDLVMPEGLNGRDLAERLTQEKPELRVIFSSGYSEETVSGALAVNERLNYLAKPYDPLRLVKLVRQRLDAPAR